MVVGSQWTGRRLLKHNINLIVDLTVHEASACPKISIKLFYVIRHISCISYGMIPI